MPPCTDNPVAYYTLRPCLARNAIIERLTRDPVVIHGMVDENGNYGGNPNIDVNLEDVTIDLAACIRAGKQK